jgi:5-deoxy-glucuronate isomerase
MTRLLVRGAVPGPDGCTARVSPRTAGWEHVGLEVFELPPGGIVERGLAGVEACLVVLRGVLDAAFDDLRWGGVGGRDHPLDSEPDAIYLPPGGRLRIEAERDGAEAALCTAPADHGATARRLPPGGVEPRPRGFGAQRRTVRPILMEDEAAEALLVCEVVTPAGHWSSFPPHKHDCDAMPGESLLEETYYHRIRPATGFGLQRVYTTDGELDEAVAFGDRDVVLVPRGYHTVAAPPGYELYYLNVMAGPTRAWAVVDDPDHHWLAKAPARAGGGKG